MSYLQTIPSDITSLIQKFNGPSVVYQLVFSESINDRHMYENLGIYLTLELAVTGLLEYLYTFPRRGEFQRNQYNPQTRTWNYAYKKMKIVVPEEPEREANWDDAYYFSSGLRIDRIQLNTRFHEHDEISYYIMKKKVVESITSVEDETGTIEEFKWTPTDEFINFEFHPEANPFNEESDDEDYEDELAEPPILPTDE